LRVVQWAMRHPFDTAGIELRLSGPYYRATFQHDAAVHRQLAAMAAILRRCGQHARIDEHYGYRTAAGYVGRTYHQITYMPAKLPPCGDEGTGEL
jgi:hypothetical protein